MAIDHLKLTEEEISSEEWVKHLSPAQKLELIEFIYKLSLFLYNSYFDDDEQLRLL
jgi:hypothetical protein